MPTPPVFLDTNIFLYAAGSGHPLREPCQSLLRRVGEGDLEATTSVEVVQEILYVLSRGGRTEDGVALARRVLALFPEALPVTVEDLAEACDLLAKTPAILARDAVHVATMRQRGLSVIVSADRAFDGISGLDRIDPGDLVGSSG